MGDIGFMFYGSMSLRGQQPEAISCGDLGIASSLSLLAMTG